MAGPSLPPAAGSINSILAAPAQFLIDARSEAWHHYALCNQCADRRNARGAALHSQRWAWRHTSGDGRRHRRKYVFPLSIGGTSDDALKAHANNWRLYEESARAAGNTPDRRDWRIVTFAHVAETRARAYADVKFGLENFKRYFSEVATFPIIPPDVTGDPVEYLVSTGLACTPEDCVRHFRAVVEGFGRRPRRRAAVQAAIDYQAGKEA